MIRTNLRLDEPGTESRIYRWLTYELICGPALSVCAVHTYSFGHKSCPVFDASLSRQ